VDILINNLWLTLGVWTLVYLSDYYLTLLTERLYQGGGNQDTASPLEPSGEDR